MPSYTITPRRSMCSAFKIASTKSVVKKMRREAMNYYIFRARKNASSTLNSLGFGRNVFIIYVFLEISGLITFESFTNIPIVKETLTS